MTKIAYVMRGIPGSGKDMYLHKNVFDFDVGYYLKCTASADHYHMVNGVYRFDPLKAREAHNKCLAKFVNLLSEDEPVIAVSNTNVHVWELMPYVRVAEISGYVVKIVRMVCDPFIAHRDNIHEVPLETVWRMHTQMENLPPMWVETPVFSGNRG